MKITHYGHSCFLAETKGFKILFDPFISPNPLTEGKVNADEVEADFILISHGHEDHIADAISIANRTGALVIANYEIATWMQIQGVSNVHPMNTGGAANFPFGKLKCVTAMHSSMLPDRSYGGNPVGFVISNDELTFYYSGDTALTLDMQLIKSEFDLDLAFMPIGDNFTMGVEDAIVATKYVGVNHVIGMHYDTFPYIEIDSVDAVEKFSEAGKKLTLIQIGESIEI